MKGTALVFLALAHYSSISSYSLLLRSTGKSEGEAAGAGLRNPDLSARLDSNQEPRRYKLRALTIELRADPSGMPDVSDNNLSSAHCIEDKVWKWHYRKYADTFVVS